MNSRYILIVFLTLILICPHVNSQIKENAPILLQSKMYINNAEVQGGDIYRGDKINFYAKVRDNDVEEKIQCIVSINEEVRIYLNMYPVGRNLYAFTSPKVKVEKLLDEFGEYNFAMQCKDKYGALSNVIGLGTLVYNCIPAWENGEEGEYVGFIEEGTQGINSDREREIFESALNVLREDDSIYAVTTYDNEIYKSFSQDKEMFFVCDEEGNFEVLEGENIFENQDYKFLGNYEDEISAEEEASYPNACRRLEQLFRSSSGPDFFVTPKADRQGGNGDHGNLDIIHSRTPLIFSGPGVKQGEIVGDYAELVDISPTILALVGAENIEGINSRSYLDERNLMKLQDGKVLENVLENTCGGGASHVVYVLSDGLNNNELMHLYETREINLPNIYSLMDNGVVYEYGAISGNPSVSIAAHTIIGTGSWQGSNGITGNFLYDHETGTYIGGDLSQEAIINYLLDPSLLIADYNVFYNWDRVETIFEAFERNFDNTITASINEPTFVGADYSVLEMDPFYVKEHKKFVKATKKKSVDVYELADNFAMLQLRYVINSRKYGPPNMLYISFLGTDHAGHSSGPHSDEVRAKLIKLDERIGTLKTLYARRGIEPTIILGADHGMRAQDTSNPPTWESALDNAGIETIKDNSGLVYLIN